MSNKIHINLLMLAGIVSSIISAAFMASTLYALAPAGWMALLAIAMGLILETFKSGFSRLAADFYSARRYAAFLVSALAVVVALCFAIWAGQERFMHSLEADQRESVALHQVRLQQIQEALESNAKELDQVGLVVLDADTESLKKRITDLYAQSKAMRSQMGWTKAEQLEASIEPLHKQIEVKEQLASDRRTQRATELREQNAALQAEQVAINGRTGKLVTTDLETAGLILRTVIVLLETAPIFLFFVSGLKQSGFNPAFNPQQNRASQDDERNSILEALRAAPGVIATSIPGQTRSSTMAFAQSPAAVDVDAGISHPKLAEGIKYVMSLAPGEKISTQDFKVSVAVGSDHVAKILSQIAADTGLVAKSGRSWVRSQEA
jgi:hypothetical protein